MPPRRAAGSRVWPDARGLQALRRPVDEGEQHELRFIVIRQPQRVRNGRALLRQHRPLAALDERDLIRADGAASAGHEVSLGQVPGSSEEPQRFPTGLGSGKQLDGGQGHRGSSYGEAGVRSDRSRPRGAGHVVYKVRLTISRKFRSISSSL